MVTLESLSNILTPSPDINILDILQKPKLKQKKENKNYESERN